MQAAKLKWIVDNILDLKCLKQTQVQVIKYNN